MSNRISGAIYKDMDTGVKKFPPLKKILDHWKDSMVIYKGDRWLRHNNGNPERKKTAKGWEMLFQWSDDTYS